jgi:hypothetical protein
MAAALAEMKIGGGSEMARENGIGGDGFSKRKIGNQAIGQLLGGVISKKRKTSKRGGNGVAGGENNKNNGVTKVISLEKGMAAYRASSESGIGGV